MTGGVPDTFSSSPIYACPDTFSSSPIHACPDTFSSSPIHACPDMFSSSPIHACPDMFSSSPIHACPDTFSSSPIHACPDTFSSSPIHACPDTFSSSPMPAPTRSQLCSHSVPGSVLTGLSQGRKFSFMKSILASSLFCEINFGIRFMTTQDHIDSAFSRIVYFAFGISACGLGLVSASPAQRCPLVPAFWMPRVSVLGRDAGGAPGRAGSPASRPGPGSSEDTRGPCQAATPPQASAREVRAAPRAQGRVLVPVAGRTWHPCDAAEGRRGGPPPIWRGGSQGAPHKPSVVAAFPSRAVRSFWSAHRVRSSLRRGQPRVPTPRRREEGCGRRRVGACAPDPGNCPRSRGDSSGLEPGWAERRLCHGMREPGGVGWRPLGVGRGTCGARGPNRRCVALAGALGCPRGLLGDGVL
ncbi:translation initiation factor IF-2 isoform X1 [Oryctolagus cuniculus]|uniref:translation initiation factor IF-2 isoform X1 n=1 Tax=Oryctolagus cuniculus TaxID=9986 RepID=UPI0038794D00